MNLLAYIFAFGVALGSSCTDIPELCVCKGTMGVGYSGSEDRTVDDIPCMEWEHSIDSRYKELPENYCRNYKGEAKGLWCYTDSRNWAYCDVPECGCDGFDKSKCGCSQFKGADYRGDINVTQTGAKCQSWGSQTPNSHYYKPDSHRYKDYGLESNNCRNPGMEAHAPWCYLEEAGGDRWQYCDVELCDETTTTSTSTKSMAYNEITVLHQMVGPLYGTTYRGVSADGKLEKPLSPGEYMSVLLDGEWSVITCDELGLWSFEEFKMRGINDPMSATVAIYSSADVILVSKVIEYDTKSAVPNTVVIKGHSNGMQLEGNRYVNINAYGTTRAKLLDGEYVSGKIDRKWQKTETGTDGAWYFNNFDKRTIGEETDLLLNIFDKDGFVISLPKVITFDGVNSNSITVESHHKGEAGGDTYKGLYAEGKFRLPVQSDEQLLVKVSGESWLSGVARLHSDGVSWSFHEDSIRNVNDRVSVIFGTFTKYGASVCQTFIEF